MRDPSDMPGGGARPSSPAAVPGAEANQPTPIPSNPATPTLARLKKRADFLHAAKGKRWHGKSLSLHAAPARDDGERDEAAVARVGFTLTKKVGNAVVRNRARRRLREAVRLSGDLPVQAGHDYVIIGRIDAVRVAFAALRREVVRAIGDVHGTSRRRTSSPRKPNTSKPNASKPNASKPNASKPNASKPNTDKPRTIRP